MKPKRMPVKEAKSGEAQKLKRRIKRLEEENKRLKGTIKTLEAYKNVTDNYIDGKLDGIPVEDVIKAVSKEKKLKDIKKKEVDCPKCGNILHYIKGPMGKIEVCKNEFCDHRKVVKSDD